MKITLYTIVLLLLCTCEGLAQKEANIWYFGDSVGVDFNSGAPVALTDGKLVTNEGCTSLSDKNGNLLFYTNGVTVYNAIHNTMPNGIGLMGSSSTTQSALAVNQPGSDSLYYIFTLDFGGGSDGFRYSIVDMSLDGGLGDIVTSSKNTLLYAPSTEKLTAVHHANGCDVWIITHGLPNDTFFVYLLSDTGLSSPVISKVGTVHPIGGHAGQMKASTDGEKIALV